MNLEDKFRFINVNEKTRGLIKYYIEFIMLNINLRLKILIYFLAQFKKMFYLCKVKRNQRKICVLSFRFPKWTSKIWVNLIISSLWFSNRKFENL